MKRQPTEAQKEAAEKRRAAFRELSKKIAAMSDDERAALADRMPGLVTCEGRTLSPFNTCAVIMQNPSRPVTVVGGFLQWKKQGRSVKKGEHGSAIWIPAKKKQGDERETNAEIIEIEQGEQTTERRRFILGTVFDVSQTEPTTTREEVTQ